MDASYTFVTTPKIIIDLPYQMRTLGGFLTQVLWNIPWENQKSSSLLSWPMTTIWPPASLCTTHHNVTWTLPAPGHGGLDWGDPALSLCRFFSCSTCPSVVLKSLTTSCVISFHCWNLPAATPTGLELWWQPTLGSYVYLFSSCSSSLT